MSNDKYRCFCYDLDQEIENEITHVEQLQSNREGVNEVLIKASESARGKCFSIHIMCVKNDLETSNISYLMSCTKTILI